MTDEHEGLKAKRIVAKETAKTFKELESLLRHVKSKTKKGRTIKGFFKRLKEKDKQ